MYIGPIKWVMYRRFFRHLERGDAVEAVLTLRVLVDIPSIEIGCRFLAHQTVGIDGANACFLFIDRAIPHTESHAILDRFE